MESSDLTRNSFVFYRSFKESISNLSDKEKLIMYEAITDFALDMKEPTLTGFPQSLFTLIRPVLEANLKRWRNGCKGGEFGKYGGAPKGNKNAVKEKQPLNNGKTTPNKDKDVDKDKEENIKRESEKEKSEFSLSRTRKAHADCDEGLRKWFEQGNAPYIFKNFEHLVTSEELSRLKEKYSGSLISETILAIENRADLRKKYKNLYRTLLTWLRKEANNG